MIKGIYAINSIAKKGILGTMLLGAVSLNAAAPNKTHAQESNTTVPTELVSKDAATALKANAITQTTPNVPTVHNPKLDKTLRKFIETEEDRKYYNNILNQVYTKNGVFLGSALVQHEINIQTLYSFLTKRTDLLIKNNINPELGKTIQGFGDKFYNTVEPNQEKIIGWMSNHFIPNISKQLQFDHKPSAQEVCERLDYIAENRSGFTKQEIAIYYMNSDAYIKHNMKNKDIQSMSNLIAYKTYILETMTMEKTISTSGMFGMGRFENGNQTIKDYYQMWMDSVDPSEE